MPQISLLTPLGDLTISEDRGHIVAVDWGRGRDRFETPLLRAAALHLQNYFDGVYAPFEGPIAASGTPFQARVWDVLRSIPLAETRSYAWVAEQLQCRSARAVGQANRNNPVPILIPCHRIVAADGSIGGYSGGDGLATKRYLLALETRVAERLRGTKL